VAERLLLVYDLLGAAAKFLFTLGLQEAIENSTEDFSYFSLIHLADNRCIDERFKNLLMVKILQMAAIEKERDR